MKYQNQHHACSVICSSTEFFSQEMLACNGKVLQRCTGSCKDMGDAFPVCEM